MKEDLVSKDVAHKDNKKKRMRGKRKKKPWPSDLGIEGMVARGLEPPRLFVPVSCLPKDALSPIKFQPVVKKTLETICYNSDASRPQIGDAVSKTRHGFVDTMN